MSRRKAADTTDEKRNLEHTIGKMASSWVLSAVDEVISKAQAAKDDADRTLRRLAEVFGPVGQKVVSLAIKQRGKRELLGVNWWVNSDAPAPTPQENKLESKAKVAVKKPKWLVARNQAQSAPKAEPPKPAVAAAKPKKRPARKTKTARVVAHPASKTKVARKKTKTVAPKKAGPSSVARKKPKAKSPTRSKTQASRKEVNSKRSRSTGKPGEIPMGKLRKIIKNIVRQMKPGTKFTKRDIDGKLDKRRLKFRPAYTGIILTYDIKGLKKELVTLPDYPGKLNQFTVEEKPANAETVQETAAA